MDKKTGVAVSVGHMSRLLKALGYVYRRARHNLSHRRDQGLLRAEEGRGGRGAGRGRDCGGTEEEFGPDEVRKIRNEVGLSQRELAEKIGVSVNSISNWETGKTSPRRGSVRNLVELVEE